MTVHSFSSEPPDWDAIARYRAGESVGDEARRIGAWLDANAADAAMLAALDDALAASLAPVAAAPPDVEAALRSVRARMHEQSSGDVIPFPADRIAPSRRRAPAKWVAVTAAIAAAAAALFVQIIGHEAPREQVASPAVAAGSPGSVIETGIGQRDSVRLPDGTRVILAPVSRLAVSGTYGHGSRDVTLRGTAWLSVRHDAASPFTLHAGTAVVRDIGTEFTARTDDGEMARVSVAVTEGSVELRGASSSKAVTLGAGDRGAVERDGRAIAERGRASDEDVAWMRGQLVFREAEMERVRSELRRWYGVDVRIADSALLSRRLTATFDSEPVDRVLEIVALALGATVERRDSVAVLRMAR
jgi:transmembrane sensor